MLLWELILDTRTVEGVIKQCPVPAASLSVTLAFCAVEIWPSVFLQHKAELTLCLVIDEELVTTEKKLSIYLVIF